MSWLGQTSQPPGATRGTSVSCIALGASGERLFPSFPWWLRREALEVFFCSYVVLVDYPTEY